MSSPSMWINCFIISRKQALLSQQDILPVTTSQQNAVSASYFTHHGSHTCTHWRAQVATDWIWKCQIKEYPWLSNWSDYTSISQQELLWLPIGQKHIFSSSHHVNSWLSNLQERHSYNKWQKFKKVHMIVSNLWNTTHRTVCVCFNSLES